MESHILLGLQTEMLVWSQQKTLICWNGSNPGGQEVKGWLLKALAARVKVSGVRLKAHGGVEARWWG